MNSQTMTAGTLTGGPSERSLRGWVLFAGITMMLLGTVAVLYDVTATLVSVMVFGWLLVFAGFMQIVHAFQVRYWSGFFLYLLDGIVRATVGTLLVLYPGAGAQTLTLILSFYFIVGGTFKAIAATVLRFPSWGWTVTSGVVSMALGVMLAMQWRTSGLWFIGFAVGIDLILYGWALLMLAAAVKKVAGAFA